MSLLKLLHGHLLGSKNHMVHVVKVPVAGKDSVLFAVLLINAGPRVRGQNSEDRRIDFGLFTEIYHLAENGRVVVIGPENERPLNADPPVMNLLNQASVPVGLVR